MAGAVGRWRRLLVMASTVWASSVAGAAAQPAEADPPTLEVHTPCGSEWTTALQAAIAVELATSRPSRPECRPVYVEAVPETCGQDGPKRLTIAVGSGEEVAVDAARGPVRALAVAAAEQVERARAACVSAAPEPWRDPRPQATDADRHLYYEQIEWMRELMRRPAAGTVLTRARVTPLLDVARGGFGLLGGASLSAWLGEGLWMRAGFGPSGLAVGNAPGIGLLGGALMLGYDAGGLAFGVGGGAGTANGVGQVDLLGRVDFYLRLGFEPSLFASVHVSLGVDADRVEFGLVAARFAVPIDRRLAVVWDAEVGLAFASGRVDVGIQAWLLGDTISSTGLALEAGLGAGALGFVPTCALGPCEDEWTVAIGPSVHLGVLLRAGP